MGSQRIRQAPVVSSSSADLPSVILGHPWGSVNRTATADGRVFCTCWPRQLKGLPDNKDLDENTFHQFMTFRRPEVERGFCESLSDVGCSPWRSGWNSAQEIDFENNGYRKARPGLGQGALLPGPIMCG